LLSEVETGEQSIQLVALEMPHVTRHKGLRRSGEAVQQSRLSHYGTIVFSVEMMATHLNSTTVSVSY
jgi:hypothetical protein